MSDLKIFNSEKFGQMRTININGEVWFVGKDVAEALGFKNSRDAILTHVFEEDKGVDTIYTLGGYQKMTIINESGLYALVFSSRLETAKDFKHWVTSEVLPVIRKTGSYQKPMSQVEMMRIQLGMIDNHEERIAELEQSMTIEYVQHWQPCTNTQIAIKEHNSQMRFA